MGFAWRGYKEFVRNNKYNTQLLPGFSNDQLFWIWASQSWCEVDNKELIEEQIGRDPHLRFLQELEEQCQILGLLIFSSVLLMVDQRL